MIGSAMLRGSIIGPMPCALATIFLALALSPPAAAKDRRVEKFEVLSLRGTIATTRHVVEDPPQDWLDTCTYSQTERISFHSTKRRTAYAFVGRYGRAVFTTWAFEPNPDVPDYASNIEIPGEVTVTRSMTYAQLEGCYSPQPTNCTVKRTFRTKLRVGGFVGRVPSHVGGTFVDLPDDTFPELDDACYVQFPRNVGKVPGLFSRRRLFNTGQKRVLDTDRIEKPPFDGQRANDYGSVTGSTIHELAGKLERRKTR